ncbi:MAG: thioredoxin family protein [Saprospirales bacterium]|nr:thioredoxin family protein [Saprospirales bacterium]MBK8923222.1 thioredoxin family protein [Saprospirales bacterium]
MERPFRTLILLAGVLLFYSAGTNSDYYVVGDKAEDFSLRNVDGRMVSLADYPDARGFIVVFTCNHCPYAQLYEQRIIDLHRRFNIRGFPVIAINPNDPSIVPDDSFDEMVVRAREKRYPFVYLYDSTQTVYPKFGANRTPHVFILDQRLVVRYIGAIDDNPETPGAVRNRYVENAVNALLRGERPDPDFTRAIGCTIKRKR